MTVEVTIYNDKRRDTKGIKTPQPLPETNRNEDYI